MIVFTQNVQGTNNHYVTWSLSPAIGTLSNGVYTAPSTITNDTQVTISATSMADSTKTATATVTLMAPVTPVGISVTPTSTTLNPGQSAHFTAAVSGSSNIGVNWSMTPNVGTLSNGVYTAPANVASQQTVTLTAISQADVTKTASAALILKPVANPPTPSVTVTLSPSTGTLSANQTLAFTPKITGTSNTGLTWSVTPSVGTLTNGVYKAPATITKQQIVTVRITSTVSSAATSTAMLTLMPAATTVQTTPPPPPPPPVAITLSPITASLLGGQSTTLKPTVTGSSNTAVTWSLSPQVGTVTNGVYQAPAIIASQQSVTVTAKSAADTTKSASATITLTPIAVTVSPATKSLGAGQSATFLPTLTGSSNSAVTWTLKPAVGTIVNGVYTAPATITSSQSVVVSATSVVDVTKIATATVSLVATAPQSTTTLLPLEVMGPAGTTATATVNVPTGTSVTGPLALWIQIHGLKYDAEASVQVNNSAWMPLSTGNVTLLGLAATYGGIGGGFHTLQMTLNLPAGVVVAGTNTITFRFNQSDGVTSGYRVLAFNVQSSGTNLIPASQFVEDDPDTWQAPSTTASDIAAGQALWRTAALTIPTASGTAPILAHCADCHSEDGRDLKYFNYSNNSIQVRSEFHGLTAQQGNQIASYIRSLNAPNPGRPWNPPYQPGPGLDSQPTANWSAGAGLNAVLDSDAEMQQYLLPGGSSAGWAATAYLNTRELPIPLQLPDWNSWLPTVHPVDAFGATFTNSQFNSRYQQVRGMLQPNSTTAYTNALGYMAVWFQSEVEFRVAAEQSISNWNANNMRATVYSIGQWLMVKQWELNQEFGLEGMPQVAYGTKANVRAWYGNAAYQNSPGIMGIPVGTGIANGSQVSWEYLSYIWYQVELALNDGQGTESGNAPVDFGYTEQDIKNLSADSGAPAASLEVMWMIKALQEYTLNGRGPQYGSGTGAFAPTAVSPLELVFSGIAEWSATPPATQAALVSAYVQAWFPQISSYTVQDYYQGADGGGRKWASPTENPGTDSANVFGGQVWYMLPRLRYVGVDPNLVNQISAWAATVWPAGNWAKNNAATCAGFGACTSDLGH